MTTTIDETPPFQTITRHAIDQMRQRRISVDDLRDAEADCQRYWQALGRWEVRGRNGICFITSSDGRAVITVLPRFTRPYQHRQRDAGCSQHRPNRRGPKNRRDARR